MAAAQNRFNGKGLTGPSSAIFALCIASRAFGLLLLNGLIKQ